MSIALACSTSLGTPIASSFRNYWALRRYRPNNDVPLATVKQSPVLQREGFTENAFEKNGEHVPTMEGKLSTLRFLLLCLRFHD